MYKVLITRQPCALHSTIVCIAPAVQIAPDRCCVEIAPDRFSEKFPGSVFKCCSGPLYKFAPGRCCAEIAPDRLSKLVRVGKTKSLRVAPSKLVRVDTTLKLLRTALQICPGWVQILYLLD